MSPSSWVICKNLRKFNQYTRAKILVKPSLTLNNRERADLRLLEDTKITLQIINKVDNITTSKPFEDLKLNDDEEYEIEFQVPPNVCEIKVSLETKVNVSSHNLRLGHRWCLKEKSRALLSASNSKSTITQETSTSASSS